MANKKRRRRHRREYQRKRTEAFNQAMAGLKDTSKLQPDEKGDYVLFVHPDNQHLFDERKLSVDVSFQPVATSEFVDFSIPLPPGTTPEQAQAIVDEINAEIAEGERCDRCGGGGFDVGCQGPCGTCEGTGRVPF